VTVITWPLGTVSLGRDILPDALFPGSIFDQLPPLFTPLRDERLVAAVPAHQLHAVIEARLERAA
jgi:hypothetical protein